MKVENGSYLKGKWTCLKRNGRFFGELLRLRLQNLMAFRLGFFGPFFVDGSMFLIQLLVFSVIYENVEKVGPWKKGEMIVFIGTFSLINAINMVLYFFGVNGIPDKIKSGEFDLYLTKPVSPLFRLSFEKINPGSFPLIIMSVFIVIYGIRTGNLQVTIVRILAYAGWVTIMTVLYYVLEVLLRSLSFFFVSSVNLVMIENAGLDLCMNLPGVVFYGIYKVIFYCILPYAVIATIPVQSLTGELGKGMVWYSAGVVVMFSLLTRIVWKTGIRQYNSVSS